MATQTTLTGNVEAAFADTADPRLREILAALVRHLHGFAQEVALTEDEWFFAIDFLTRTGHMSDDRRQEFVLLSDVLGLSMLTVGVNQGGDSQATEPTVFGPFFFEGSPFVEEGGDVARGFTGDPLLVRGRVRDTAGATLRGARVEVWQADDKGFYDVQQDLDEPRGRGHLFSLEDGSFSFSSTRPVAYPIPDDGPVGQLMHAAGRSVMRPAHVHFMISMPGHRTLITHVFDRTDPYLESDAVFGVKASLVADFVPDGSGYTLDFDFVLSPEAIT